MQFRIIEDVDLKVHHRANKLYKRIQKVDYILSTYGVLHVENLNLYKRCYSHAMIKTANKLIKDNI